MSLLGSLVQRKGEKEGGIFLGGELGREYTSCSQQRLVRRSRFSISPLSKVHLRTGLLYSALPCSSLATQPSVPSPGQIGTRGCLPITPLIHLGVTQSSMAGCLVLPSMHLSLIQDVH